MFIKEWICLNLSEQTNRGKLLINVIAQYSQNLSIFWYYVLFAMHFNNAFTFCWSLQIRALCLIAWPSMSGLFWAASVHLQSRNVLWMISSKYCALLSTLAATELWWCLALLGGLCKSCFCPSILQNIPALQFLSRPCSQPVWDLGTAHNSSSLPFFEEHPTPNFGSCILMIYITMQCLTGMGRVQGVFHLV